MVPIASLVMPLALLLAVGCGAQKINCPNARQAAITECNGRLGCFIPDCEGSDYAAVQCRGSGCYCVTTGGSRIGSYRWNHGRPTSNCECARAEANGQNVVCALNGGFSPRVS